MDDLDSFEEENQLDEDFSLVDFTSDNLIYNDKKITSPIMTIYEKVSIISERIKYLDNGYKTTIEEEIKKLGLSKSYDIAMLEFEMNKLPPYYLKRVMPNNTYEVWKHDDFEFFPK
tara:strand:+ start:276 stop:623 length:348 start_codon:yes stop_codon:yes gene_type:complete